MGGRAKCPRYVYARAVLARLSLTVTKKAAFAVTFFVMGFGKRSRCQSAALTGVLEREGPGSWQVGSWR